MVYKIKLDTDFTGRRMGLVFIDGVAETNDAFLATRLKSKGYTVTAEKGTDDTKAPEQVEKSEGKKKGNKKDKEKAAPEQVEKSEGKKKGNKKDKEKAAPEPAPALEPEPTVDPESNEPPDLPPIDNEGDE